MKDTLIEIKKNLQGNNSRMNKAENEINDLEHKKEKTNQYNKMNPKKKKKDTISSLWDNFQWSNIHIMGVPEEEEKKQEIVYL